MTTSPPFAETVIPHAARPAEGADATATADVAALRDQIERVVRGRRHAVDLVVCALLAGGHVLVEDLPGSGKTTLARTVARAVGGAFRRIQATADLMPADITGSGIWNSQAQAFTFVPGPIFTNVLLVDELNRTPARTQSAFLEAMEEGAVTVDGRRHALEEPFFMVATQNPFDQHGTYPLPEGQLDRFAVRIHLGALDEDDERRIVRENLAGPAVEQIGPVLTLERLRILRRVTRELHVADPVLHYAVDLVRTTRLLPGIAVGASSRAAITLVRCAQATALMSGRSYVTPDDVRAIAVPVLAHRLVPAGPQATGAELVTGLLARFPVPVHF